MKWLYAACCAACLIGSALYYFGVGAQWEVTRDLSDRELAEFMIRTDCTKPENDWECGMVRQEQRRRKWLGWVGYKRRQQ